MDYPVIPPKHNPKTMPWVWPEAPPLYDESSKAIGVRRRDALASLASPG
jgi:hypothetical protein